MNKYCLGLGILLLSTGCNKFMPLPIGGTNIVDPPTITPVTHAYLLMGQSNMGDRCHNIAAHYLGSPGCSTGQELGLVMQDNSAMYIQCAVGGTALARWVPGGDLYEGCLAKVPKDLPVKGLFFFQGEADAMVLNTSYPWALQFSGMVNDLRQRLQLPALPVVFAQIGAGSSSLDWQHIQQEQASVSMPHVAMVTTSDLTPFDSVHFTLEEYYTIAQRMKSAFQTL